MKNVPNIFKIVSYGSSEYKTALALRQEILREPLGLCFSEDELEKEKNHIHFIGLKDGALIATASLVPEQTTCKMRQVAIRADMQGLGIGSKLIDYCELYATLEKFESICCHARGTAVLFYTKKDYVLEGEYFTEIGMPHVKMQKVLTP